MKKNKVLIVYAGREAILPRVPTSLVVLAAYIREHGFEPYLFDTRIDKNIPWDLSDFLAVGISSMTVGLKYGIEVVKEIKKKHPNMIFIWGGVHITFFPEQSAKSEYVDIVIKSEGEESFLEVLQALQKNKSLDKIKGITYFDKKKQDIVNNPNREFIDLNKLPFPAYDLIDINKYADKNDGFNYETSRGCPNRCTFCYVNAFHYNKWRAKSVDKVLDEIEKIIKIYKVKKLIFKEDNVFVDKKRVFSIAQGFIDRKFNIEWEATVKANYIAYYSDKEMKLLKESGLCQAAIGGESGSERILKLIQKDITKEEIKKAVLNCLKADIRPIIAFMIGIPGESEKIDLPKTIEIFSELKNLVKDPSNMHLAFTIYTPYPGTSLYKEAINLGYKPPKNFEDWTNWSYNDTDNTPWLSYRLKRKLETISIIVRFWYYLSMIKHFSKEYQKEKIQFGFLSKILFKLGIPILKTSAYLRWKTKFFYFPYEWDLFRWYRDIKTEIH